MLEMLVGEGRAFSLLVIGSRGQKLFTWRPWMGALLFDEELGAYAREGDVFYIGMCGWRGWRKMKELDEREQGVVGLLAFMKEYDRFKKTCRAIREDPLPIEEARTIYKSLLRKLSEPKKKFRKVENLRYQQDDQKKRALQIARNRSERGI